MSPTHASEVLEGLVVIDLTRARAGPAATRQLADWGADVIRIEIPEGSQESDVLSGSRDGGDFQNLHRNKRSLALDLKTAKGLAIFRRVAAKADVVVENFRPAVKYRLGIDQETILKLNPRIIYASISGFGEIGPYKDRPGVDQIVQGMSGLMSVTGEIGRGPMRAGIAVGDLSAGVFCAMGVLLALLSRAKTGQGQWINTSLLQSLIFMLDFQAARWLVQNEVPAQAGNDHPTAIPMGVFYASDGPINIAASGQRLWTRFCEAVGALHLMNDERFKTSAARSANRVALNALIGDIIKTDTGAAWVERLNQKGIPAGPIYRLDQVFSDPQVQALGIAGAVPTASGRQINLLNQPINMSKTPSRLVRGAPTSGEHGAEILAEFGYSASEIEAFKKQKIIS
jgi:crotonobetainyl-CoA:carnitine CoA-transferase CaiB-like acyl-CoA transferase